MSEGRKPPVDREAFAAKGDQIFEREILPCLGADDTVDPRKFVAVDVTSGAYEIDRDERAAVDRLSSRKPDVQIWLRRVGSRFVHRIGGWRAQAAG